MASADFERPSVNISSLIQRFEGAGVSMEVQKPLGRVRPVDPQSYGTIKKVQGQSQRIQQQELPQKAHDISKNMPKGPNTAGKVSNTIAKGLPGIHYQSVSLAYAQAIRSTPQTVASAKPSGTLGELEALSKEIGAAKMGMAKATFTGAEKPKAALQAAADKLCEYSLAAGSSPGVKSKVDQMQKSLLLAADNDPALKQSLGKEFKAANSLSKTIHDLQIPVKDNEKLSAFLQRHGVTKSDLDAESKVLSLSPKVAELKTARRAAFMEKGGVDFTKHSPTFAKTGESMGLNPSIVKAAFVLYKGIMSGKDTNPQLVKLSTLDVRALSTGKEVMVESRVLGVGGFKATWKEQTLFTDNTQGMVTQRPHTKMEEKAFEQRKKDKEAAKADHAGRAEVKQTEQKKVKIEKEEGPSEAEEEGAVFSTSVVHGSEETVEEGAVFSTSVVHGSEETVEEGDVYSTSVVHNPVKTEEEGGVYSTSVVHGSEETVEEGDVYSTSVVHGSKVSEEEGVTKEPAVGGKKGHAEDNPELDNITMNMFGGGVQDQEKDKSDFDDIQPYGMTRVQLNAHQKFLNGRIDKLQPGLSTPVTKMSTQELQNLKMAVEGSQGNKEIGPLIDSLLIAREEGARRDKLNENPRVKPDMDEAVMYKREIAIQQTLAALDPKYIEGLHKVVATTNKFGVQELTIVKFEAGVPVPEIAGVREGSYAVDLKALVELNAENKLTNLEQAKLLDLFSDSLHGIKTMHDNGYIHRDFKFDNVLIDKSGHGKLTDFGSVVQKGDPYQSSFIGTAIYTAPESLIANGDVFPGGVALTQGLNEKMDIWSIGMCLHGLIENEEVDSHPIFQTMPEQQFGSPSAIYRHLFGHYSKKSMQEDYNQRCEQYINSATSNLQSEARQLIVDCCRLDPSKRPNIDTVIARLEVLKKKSNS